MGKGELLSYWWKHLLHEITIKLFNFSEIILTGISFNEIRDTILKKNICACTFIAIFSQSLRHYRNLSFDIWMDTHKRVFLIQKDKISIYNSLSSGHCITEKYTILYYLNGDLEIILKSQICL